MGVLNFFFILLLVFYAHLYLYFFSFNENFLLVLLFIGVMYMLISSLLIFLYSILDELSLTYYISFFSYITKLNRKYKLLFYNFRELESLEDSFLYTLSSYFDFQFTYKFFFEQYYHFGLVSNGINNDLDYFLRLQHQIFRSSLVLINNYDDYNLLEYEI